MPHLCETVTENQLAAVVRQKTKNEKLAWQRKLKRMEVLIDQLRPLEDEILKIMERKLPIMDDVAALRAEMVKECVHPRDLLLHKGGWIECKFCNAKLSIPTDSQVSEAAEEDEGEDE